MKILYIVIATFYCNRIFSEHQTESVSVSEIIATTNLPNLTKCSDLICGDSTINCGVWDQCYCRENDEISCSSISNNSFYIIYDSLDKLLSISGVTTERRFQDVLHFLSQLIMPLTLQTLTISFFTGMNVSNYVLINDSRCLLHAEDFTNVTSVLNLSDFLKRDEVNYLGFSNNNIQTIEGTFGEKFQNLSELRLSTNFISMINDTLLKGLFYLEELDLSMNRIGFFQREDFQDLRRLQKLDLSKNCIDNLTEDVFWDLHNLEELMLDSNQLTLIPPELFSKNFHLQFLNFSRNHLQTLPAIVFESLRKLKTLWLSNNEITNLPEGIFQNNELLETVNLFDNKLRQLPVNFLQHNWHLKRIDFTKNDFQELPAVNQININNLSASTDIFLRNNNITYMPFISNRIKSASMLDLSDNCITYFDHDFASLDLITDPLIMSISCENCCLRYIPYIMLIAVKDSALLKKNCISSLSNDDMDILVSLSEVDLSDNSIQRIHISWTYPIIQNYSRFYDSPNTLYILNNNPVICDCHLFRFIQFLNDDSSGLADGEQFSKIRFQVDKLYCAAPHHLKNRNVAALTNLDLTCEVKNDNGCPIACQCFYQPANDFSFINCSHKNLTEFPALTMNKQRLILLFSNNNISTLPQDDEFWSNVHSVFLSFNHLYSVKNISVFPSMKELYLDHNFLTEIEDPVIEILRNNDCKVSLAENPVKCSCELMKLKTLLFEMKNVIDSQDLFCLFPNGMKVFLPNATRVQLCPGKESTENTGITIGLCILAAFIVLSCIVVVLVYRNQQEVKRFFTH